MDSYNVTMSDLDFVTDKNPDIFIELYNQGVTPDYVLDSDRYSEEDIDKLNRVAFADQEHKLYPCHTKAACWQSAAHFIGRQKDDKDIAACIEKMAAYHGITEDVNKIKPALGLDKVEELEKKASEETPEENYALTVDFGDFENRGVQSFYPVNNYAQVIQASDDATEDFRAGKMPMGVMRKVAYIISNAADEMGVPMMELTAEVKSFGTKAAPDPNTAMLKLASRRNLGIDMTPYETAITNLNNSMAGVSYDDAINMANMVAEQLCLMDKSAGVRYSAQVPHPYALLFCGPTKADIEKAASSTVSILGINVPVVDLVNTRVSDIETRFTKEAAETIKTAIDTVRGDCTIEKSAAASNMIAGLSEEAQQEFLSILADVAW